MTDSETPLPFLIVSGIQPPRVNLRDNSESSLAISAEPDENTSEVTGVPPDGSRRESSDPAIDGEASSSPSGSNSRSDMRELLPGRKPVASASAGPQRRRIKRMAPGIDPINRILSLMERERRIGMSIGLAGALVVHGAGAAHGYSALMDMSAFAAAVRSAVADDIRATFAVEVNKPPPPPPPPQAEPEPEKPQVQQKAPAAPQNQPQEKPPAPAQAAKVLTAEPDPSEPLDLTDQGFVSGEGDRFAGGVTSATGTSKTAVRDTNAKPGGVVGGTGTGAPPPPPAPKVDLSRPATPASRDWGDCGFPAEADVEQIDFMRLSIVVTVGTDGRAQSVTVLKDPGYGFGNQARQCALRKSYNVGFNVEGKPVVTTTPPFIVTFRR